MVGGINHSPGIGRIVANIITGKDDWLPTRKLKSDRFNADFDSDPRLLARCEAVYARMYQGTA